ncbi:MAG: hypothetical protein ACI4MC_05410 [Candidatus Coproplasma sp.]
MTPHRTFGLPHFACGSVRNDAEDGHSGNPELPTRHCEGFMPVAIPNSQPVIARSISDEAIPSGMGGLYK